MEPFRYLKHLKITCQRVISINPKNYKSKIFMKTLFSTSLYGCYDYTFLTVIVILLYHHYRYIIIYLINIT